MSPWVRSISCTLARRRTWRSSPEIDGAEERGHDLGRDLGADHAAAEAEHVDAVVLDGLMGGVGVVDRAARTPSILPAATDTPAPEPQTMIPRSAWPADDRAWPTSSALSG